MFGKEKNWNGDELESLRNEVAALRAQVEALQRQVRAMQRELNPPVQMRCHVRTLMAMQSRGIGLGALARATGVHAGTLRNAIFGRTELLPEEQRAVYKVLGMVPYRSGDTLAQDEIDAILLARNAEGEFPASAPPEPEAEPAPDPTERRQSFIQTCPRLIDRMEERGMSVGDVAARAGLAVLRLRTALLGRVELDTGEKNRVAAVFDLQPGVAFWPGGIEHNRLLAILDGARQASASHAD